jgi:ABC-type molybdate transport system permease subunit
MTNQVLIKKIGFVEILLNDYIIDEFSLKTALINMSIIAIVCILLSYVLAICNKSDFFNVILESSVLFLVFTLLGLALGIFDVTFPAYRVSTNADINSIYIKKTTDEADQIAICKAASDIENQIKAKAEKLEKLKQIAEKCK